MKYLFILLFGLFSCTPQFHINKAKKHTEKAIDKGAVLTTSNDTLYINDTIITERIIKRGDTLYIERVKTIEKVIYQKGEIRYITKKDKRKEYREEKREAKRDFKLNKSKEKTKRTEIRKSDKKFPYWIILLIIGGIITIILLWKKRNQ